MRLLFIRHGDPDYTIDSLTQKGDDEAAALAAIIADLNPGTIYLSPLGRAQRTASFSLNALGAEGTTCPWLQEFTGVVDTRGSEDLMMGFPHARQEDGTYGITYIWDIMPEYCAKHPEIMDPEKWRESDLAKHSNVLEVYDEVVRGLDALLAKHGYVREGHGLYRVERETTETLTFFCHFGISAVMMSIIWGCSPFLTLQYFCMLPSSVSELVSEERDEGKAMFRALRIGDQSHLYMAGQRPSFAARFREVYSDTAHRN